MAATDGTLTHGMAMAHTKPVAGIAMALSTQELDWDKAIEQGEETCTTDAGSGSEAESTSSVASANNDRRPSRLTLGLRNPFLQRKRPHFRGTPLEPIPGTPVAASCRDMKTDAQELMRPSTSLASRVDDGDRRGIVSVVNVVRKGLFGTVPAQSPQPRSRPGCSAEEGVAACSRVFTATAIGSWSTAVDPQSSTKQTSEATFARAKRDGVPVKVELPEQLARVAFHGGLDLSLPMKKRPVFEDVAGKEPAEALSRLEASQPIKKKISPFLSSAAGVFSATACMIRSTATTPQASRAAVGLPCAR